MSGALITLFAISALGALGMAIYGFRVLLGRWEQPRHRQVPQVAPPPPIQVAPPPPAVQQVAPVAGWVAMPRPYPAPPPPPPFAPMATPFPLAATPSVAAPAYVPTPTRPPPAPEAARFARGSIPPDVSPELYDLQPDDDDANEFENEDPTSRDPIIQRGPRFSVIRSSRR
jgi:hypothetical protein